MTSDAYKRGAVEPAARAEKSKNLMTRPSQFLFDRYGEALSMAVSLRICITVGLDGDAHELRHDVRLSSVPREARGEPKSERAVL